MAKQVKKENTKTAEPGEKLPWKMKRQYKVVLGCLLVLLSVGLLVAFISFFMHGQEDQSVVTALSDRTKQANNWLGKVGAYLANFFIYRGFGAASFLFVKLFFITGAFLVLDLPLKKLKSTWFWDLFVIIILSILFGFFANSIPELGGTIGYEMNLFFQDYIGKVGTLLVLVFGLIIYLLFKIKISPDSIKSFFEKKHKEISDDIAKMKTPISDTDNAYNLEEYAIEESKDELGKVFEEPYIKPTSQFEVNKEALKPTISSYSEIELEPS
uniref:DNA translocase FtsK 4TM domain-containing protein n=1 Tax=Flavobacterium sp. TaxID=239 RepID=UPI003753A711